MKGFIKLCGKKGKGTILRLLGCKHFRSQEFRSSGERRKKKEE
jgi:hypothetical protein